MEALEHNIRVLIVDDEADYRETTAKRLRVRGFEVDEAVNGEDALKRLSESVPDVVLMDVKMPVMDGLTALSLMKERYPEVEVIMITGFACSEDGVLGIKTGAYDYLCKPVEFDHLISKIQHAHEKILREEEKKQEAEMRAKIEKQMIATERLASVGVMASGVAHEINNPLAIIGESAGWMQMLMQKPEWKDVPFRDSFEMAVDKIVKNVERARRITHQLLGFVRKDDFFIKEMSLRDVLGEVVSLVEPQARDHDITMEMDIPEDAPIIRSDPYQLRQVLVNLLANAIQASQRGQAVRISVAAGENGMEISVRDHGTGISGENLQRIFEPFFTTKSSDKGTGLGLFVSSSIVEKLGGRIEVESEFGKGSVFKVMLPSHHA